MARKHGAAQARRRASRARARARAEQVLGAPVANQEQARELETLIAAASGSTDLPLSDRGDAWDAGAASKGLTDAQLGKAFFWKEPDGDPSVKSSYKLGFAENRDGTLTAVWRGVTAAAAALQGARGGVDIPEADVAGVKSRIEAYYKKAATAFKDPDIKPPWAAEDSSGKESATSVSAALAYAECVDGGRGDYAADYRDRLEFWWDALGVLPALDSVAEQFAAIADSTIEAFDAETHAGVSEMEYEADREDAEQALNEAAPKLATFYITDGASTTASWPMTYITSSGTGTFTMTFDAKPSVEDVLPDAHKPKTRIPKRNGSPRNLKAPDQPIPTAGQQLQWTATLCPEGALTDDGRAFAPDSISWRELPLTLMGLIETSAEGGHDGAQVAGRIDNIWRENGLIKGSGTFDDGEFGSMIAKMVGDGTLRGISVDLAIHKYDFGPKSDWFNADGEWAPKEQTDDEAPNLLDLLFGESDEDMIFMVTDATIGMACHSSDTEVLTEAGWKRFPEIKRGQKVATRNQLTKAIEYHEPFYYHAEKHTGKMLRFHNSRNLDLCVTPNHRMLVVNRKTGDEVLMRADELAKTPKGKWGIPLAAGWHDQDVEEFTIESELQEIAEGFCQCGCGTEVGRVRERWEGGGRGPGTITRFVKNHGHGYNTDPLTLDGTDFAAFMGMYLAEGCVVQNRPGHVSIAQLEKSRGYEPYRELLTRMFGHASHDGKAFFIKNVRLWRYLKQFGKSPDKFVPAELKQFSRAQLQTFFDFYMMGDGYARQPVSSTVSRQLADDLQEIAQKIGMWARITWRDHTTDTVMKDGRVIKAENKRRTYRVSYKTTDLDVKRNHRATWLWKADEVEYNDMVYCVSVPNEVFYVRRNGLPAWSGNTVCPFQAFADAMIVPAGSLAASLQHDAVWTVSQQGAYTVVAKNKPCECESTEGDTETLTAAATDAPAGPPSAWFANPELAEPTPLTVDDEGRIYGHAATWETCHIGFGAETCVKAPHSKCDYAQYLLGEVVSAEGDHIHVGTITMNTGHANQSLQLSQAAAHYDHTGTGVADVTVGEDQHGIWFAGAVRPGLSEEAVRVLRAAKLSGDWRNMNGNLELVALLAVNVPGFPVPRPRASIVASGEEQQVAALTAAGIVDVNAQAFAELAAATGEVV